ncbi:MAG: ABC transporter substrate-binding protein [Candidatus Nezhaarchaeales archaeon]
MMLGQRGASKTTATIVSIIIAIAVIAIAVYLLIPQQQATYKFTLSASFDKPYYRVGEQATLSIEITNLNDTDVTRSLVVQLDGETIYSEDVLIPASSTKTVTVNFEVSRPANVTVSIGGETYKLELNAVRCVVDFRGKEVEIPYKIERAVVLAEYQIVYALGAWDSVVGVSRYAYSNPIMLALKDINITTVPSPGTPWSLNLEELVALNPQVVLTYGFSVKTNRTVEQIENLGIPCVVVSLSKLDDLYRLIRLYGKIFNKEDRAEELITLINQTLDLVKERTANLTDEERPKVIHTWSKPLKVTGGLGVTNTLIELAGGKNPAALEFPDEKYPTVSIEKIIEWEPDVIIIWGAAKYGVEDILNNSQWQSIPAVQNGNVYKYPRTSTWAPEIAILALRFAKWIHPELFSDINIQEYADQLFMQVYGIPSPFEWEP